MTARTARCACGQLTAICRGDPLRVSLCHCRACKRRTGSAFSWNARWSATDVTIKGQARTFTRIGDDGYAVSYNFCPTCGVTVHYRIDAWPDQIAIPVGGFADPDFPAPTVSVYDPTRRCAWLGPETVQIDRWS